MGGFQCIPWLYKNYDTWKLSQPEDRNKFQPDISNLEDKIVKKFFNELTTFCICEPSVPICKCDIEQQFSYPGKKKYLPTEKEKESNPRSKSAIMRYVVKL